MPWKGEVTHIFFNPLRFLLPLFLHLCFPLHPPQEDFPKMLPSSQPFKHFTSQSATSLRLCVADFTQRLRYYITAYYRKPQSWTWAPFFKVLGQFDPQRILFGSFFYLVPDSSCHVVKTLLFPPTKSYIFLSWAVLMFIAFLIQPCLPTWSFL